MIFKQTKKTGKDFEQLTASSIANRSRVVSLEKRVETFTGNTIPSNAKGKNGDIAILKSGDVYVKTGGRWA